MGDLLAARGILFVVMAAGVVLTVSSAWRVRRGRSTGWPGLVGAVLPLAAGVGHVLLLETLLSYGIRQFTLASEPGQVAGDWMVPGLGYAALSAAVGSVLLVVVALVRPRAGRDGDGEQGQDRHREIRWEVWLLVWAAAGFAALTLQEAWIAGRIAVAHASVDRLVREAVAPAAGLRAATLGVWGLGGVVLGAALIRAWGRSGRAWAAAVAIWGLGLVAVGVLLIPRPDLAHRLGAPQGWETHPPADFDPVRVPTLARASPADRPAYPNVTSFVLPGRFLLPQGEPCTAPRPDFPADGPLVIDRRATVGDVRLAFECLPHGSFRVVWPVAGAYGGVERRGFATWYPLLAGLTHEVKAGRLRLVFWPPDAPPMETGIAAEVTETELRLEHRGGVAATRRFHLSEAGAGSEAAAWLTERQRLQPNLPTVPIAVDDDVSAEALLEAMATLQASGLQGHLPVGGSHPPERGELSGADPSKRSEAVAVGPQAVVVFTPPDLAPDTLDADNGPTNEAQFHVWFGVRDLEECLGERALDVQVVHGTSLVLEHSGSRRRIDIPNDWPRSIGAVLWDERREPCLVYAETGPSSLGAFLTQGVAEYFGVATCRQEGIEGVCK